MLTSGVLTLRARRLEPGPHRLVLEIKGANPSAIPSCMVGLDYVQLVRIAGK